MASIKVEPDYLHSLDAIKNFEPSDMFYTDYDGEVPFTRTYVRIKNGVLSRSLTVQNVAPILQENARMRTYSDENWDASKEWKFVARVPEVVWLKWERLGITDDPVALKKALRLHKDFLVTRKSI